ncbi:hypothetical protein [Mycobacterium talmoniae]|uniref:hypothetical protein n=1 Tax=Mycobacterium talmoniae TaxID=1858794 RepID=UPI001058D5B6|nr:hypothetical protein [Mycobacterium talmoniae]
MTSHPTPAPVRRPNRPLWVITAVLVVLTVAVGIGAVLLTVTKNRPSHQPPDYAAIEGAARDTALALISITPATARDDVANVQKFLIGEALDQYRRGIDAVVATAEQQHTSTKGTVIAVGVTTADASSATVLVFADQAVTQGSGQPNLDRSRLQFHLVKNSGP